MDLTTALQQNSLIYNSKGGKYYNTSFNANLDLYAGISRFNREDEIKLTFRNAYHEDRVLALANFLYILDIREGKGERRIFKTIFKDLCDFAPDDAKIILSHIGSLGRYDYILEGLFTEIEDDVLELIKDTLQNDLASEHPTLLAKWLPSHRTHGVSSQTAKYLIKKLGINEKEYRQMLSKLRSKINIVEKNLSSKNYDNIVFEEVPTKAMLKYTYTFNEKIGERFSEYKKSLVKGEAKINTNGLFCYEVIKNVYNQSCDQEIMNAMWENQKSIDTGDNNILVVADTSGSMMSYGALPYCSAIGLAIYTAERNKGIFKDMFITFSSNPMLQEVRGDTIFQKVRNIKSIVSNTDIDKVFELLLKSMKDSNATQEDLPSHILIISDMEFDDGVYSKGGTNFTGWKKAFKEEGFELPKVVFWNVAGRTDGLPVTKNDNDVIMISGFSTNLLENIFNIENFNPLDQMLKALEKYINLINENR